MYKNTQVHLIKDTLICFGLSLIYPLLLYLLPGVFRIMSLRAKNANRECLYKISKILQLIWNIIPIKEYKIVNDIIIFIIMLDLYKLMIKKLNENKALI